MSMAKCKICTSPYRTDIERAYKRGVGRAPIAKKYHELMGLTKINLYIKIGNHVRRKHPPLIDPVPQVYLQQEGEVVAPPEEMGTGSFQDYAKRMLDKAMADPEMFTGKKLTHNQVIAAQRALIEESKVKNERDALKFAMVRFLRGQGASLEGDEKIRFIEGDTE